MDEWKDRGTKGTGMGRERNPRCGTAARTCLWSLLAGMLLAHALLTGTAFRPAPARAEKKIVRLASLDWEPYIGSTLPGNGYVAEVVREAFRRSGYETIIRFLPWARAVEQAEQLEWDGLFPVYDAPERRAAFVLSAPLPAAPLGFFERKGAGIRYTTLADLKPYRIGVVRGYMNTRAFDEADYLRKSAVNDDLSNIRRLLARRIDLFVADKLVGFYLIRKHMPRDADKIEFVQPPLEEKELFLAFGRTLPRTPEYLRAFDEGLRSMRADGTLDAILRHHGLDGIMP